MVSPTTPNEYLNHEPVVGYVRPYNRRLPAPNTTISFFFSTEASFSGAINRVSASVKRPPILHEIPGGKPRCSDLHSASNSLRETETETHQRDSAFPAPRSEGAADTITWPQADVRPEIS